MFIKRLLKSFVLRKYTFVLVVFALLSALSLFRAWIFWPKDEIPFATAINFPVIVNAPIAWVHLYPALGQVTHITYDEEFGVFMAALDWGACLSERRFRVDPGAIVVNLLIIGFIRKRIVSRFVN
jgi:hypothetical protein